MRLRYLNACILSALSATSVIPRHAAADAITITDPYIQWYNLGPNNLDFGQGAYIRVGATSVVPNGVSGGTTGIVTTTNVSNGQTVSAALGAVTSTAVPNFFGLLVPICTSSCSATSINNPANLTNPFVMTFTNPNTNPTTAQATVQLAGNAEIPFVQSVTLSGTSQAPTFSWTPPPGTTVDGYRINIYQNNQETFNSAGALVNTGQVTSVNVGPNTTSYTVNSGDFLNRGSTLIPNTQYTIEISVLQTRDGSTTNLSNANVSAISRVYSNFQVTNASLPALTLPTTTVQNGQVTFGFNVAVAPGITYYLDPTSAIGYIFQTGVGNPNFASVSLPTGNSGLYSLYLWSGSAWIFDTQLAGGQLFNFTGPGVDRFEVLGIDPALDPTNPTAFVTAVTFTGSGDFTGTMTPITSAVPEASTWAMMLIGFVGIGALVGRRKLDRVPINPAV